jgi:hypothetical protein
MTRRGLSFPVLISFNELVWLYAFLLALLCVYQSGLLRDARERLHIHGGSTPDAPVPDGPSAQPSAQTIHRELVGLRGRLQRVVLVVDRSKSMASGRRWEETIGTIRTWITHLAFDEAAVVLFNDTTTAYPAHGMFLVLSGSAGGSNRAALLRQLDAVVPSGTTNTLAALQRAYAYQRVDTIILFTDGSPDRNARGFDRAMANEIYALAQRHGREIPINTVGLGKYFDPQFGEFLRRLPDLTGGTFIGR